MVFGDPNLNISYPNFCIGPMVGTFASVDQSSVTTVLRIKNVSGAIIGDYTLSSNIIDELVMLEYCGPLNTTSVIDNATFFTLEKINSSTCIIKRWEILSSNLTLNLKQQIIKFDTGNYYYDALGMAVEHYRRTFSQANVVGTNYLYVNDADKLSSGMRLFLGPSSYPFNDQATEYVTVSHIVGNKVYLNSNIIYQYVEGDDVIFYNNFYLVSSVGYAGDTTKGSIFKLDAYTGTVKSVDTRGIYRGVSATRWCSYVKAVVCVCGNNAMFVRPYNSYQNWKSIFLNNIESDKTTLFPVYDIVFDGITIYKLTQKTTGRDDEGNLITYSWVPYYNYQQDTLLPYAYSLKTYVEKSTMVGENDITNILLQLRDQFGIGLLDVNVDVDVKSGDLGVVLDPLDGKVITDSNGEAVVGYTSGSSYDGITEITGKANESNPGATGSQYVWASSKIKSILKWDNVGSLFQVSDSFEMGARLVRQMIDQLNSITSIFNRTFFTTPGGDWINPSPYSSQVNIYLPHLNVGQGDGPQASLTRGWVPGQEDPPSFENRITQILDFESERKIQQLGIFSVDQRIEQLKEFIGGLQISQLKLSKHGHYVAPDWYDYLWTKVSLHQFVFVEDALPKFWSEKNSINTNIWIRLRPFATDLDGATLKFMVREVSYVGDTGWYDVASQGTITYFDVGGGLQGIDFLYNPLQDFHHNVVVYIHIEICDDAGNSIYVDYYFCIIPDYRFPYLTALCPGREQTNVFVDTNIYFEVKDEGVGVDISTFEMFVNSRIVIPTSTVKVSNFHYKITYDPPENFYFGKDITIGVTVSDLSESANTLVDSYRFYTVESDKVWFTKLDPSVCRRGLLRFQDVEFLALGFGGGVDKDTLRVQIHNKDVDNKVSVLPVIYRVS